MSGSPQPGAASTNAAASPPSSEAPVRSQDAARETFTSLMSHAFGGALQPIVGALALLADEAYGPLTDEQQRLVAQANTGVEQLRQLQDDILLLARIQAQTLRLDAQPIALTTMLRSAIAQAQQPYPPTPARVIASHVSPALPPLLCDADLLRRALAAVVENALRFSPPDAPIAVEARKRNGWVVICVRDGGAGIAPDEASRLFAPLVIGTRPLQHVGVGLGVGLGLAVARACVEAHGGRRAQAAPPASMSGPPPKPGAPFSRGRTHAPHTPGGAARAGGRAPGGGVPGGSRPASMSQPATMPGATFALELPLAPITPESSHHLPRQPQT